MRLEETSAYLHKPQAKMGNKIKSQSPNNFRTWTVNQKTTAPIRSGTAAVHKQSILTEWDLDWLLPWQYPSTLSKKYFISLVFLPKFHD